MSQASNNDVGQFLEEHVWPNLDAASAGLLADLNPRPSGANWTLSCPQCEKRRAHYRKGSSIRCNRIESCGYVSSVWSYLRDYKALPKKEIFQSVCAAVGVTPPDNSNRPRQLPVDTKIRKLLSGSLEQHLHQVQERWSYSDKDMALIKAYCGYYPDMRFIESQLTDKEIQIAKHQGWLKPSLAGRLFGYWRQPSGSLGFWARHLGDAEPKYLFKAAMVKAYPYLIEECVEGKPLVGVEGGRDALALKMMGYKNCIGTGGSHLNIAQARTIATRFDHLIYIIDGDIAGMKGMIKTIANACAFGITTEFVILPSESGMDVDDYRRLDDSAGLKAIWEKRVDAGTALALAYVDLVNSNSGHYLTSELVATRASLSRDQKNKFYRTLNQFGIDFDFEGDACRDMGVLLDYFDLQQANQIIGRRYGIEIEFVRTSDNG